MHAITDNGPTEYVLSMPHWSSCTDVYIVSGAALLEQGGELVELVGRDARLPTFYRFKSHPKITADGVQNIYVYLQDTKKTEMKNFYEYVKEMKLPVGTQAGVRTAGRRRFVWKQSGAPSNLTRVSTIVAWGLRSSTRCMG